MGHIRVARHFVLWFKHFPGGERNGFECPTFLSCETLYAMLRSHRTVKHIWFFADTQSQLKKTKRA